MGLAAVAPSRLVLRSTDPCEKVRISLCFRAVGAHPVVKGAHDGEDNYSRTSTEFRDARLTSLFLSVQRDRAACIDIDDLRCAGQQLSVHHHDEHVEKFLGSPFLRLMATALPSTSDGD